MLNGLQNSSGNSTRGCRSGDWGPALPAAGERNGGGLMPYEACMWLLCRSELVRALVGEPAHPLSALSDCLCAEHNHHFISKRKALVLETLEFRLCCHLRTDAIMCVNLFRTLN